MLLSNRRLAGVFLTTLTLSVLAACGGSERNCVEDDEPYLAARSEASLRIPEGLTSPDRSASLTIPNAPAAANPSGSGCLAEPPSYFRSSGTVARSPEEVVASWAQAWAAREGDAVIALYSSTFVAPTDAVGRNGLARTASRTGRYGSGAGFDGRRSGRRARWPSVASLPSCRSSAPIPCARSWSWCASPARGGSWKRKSSR